MTDKEKVHYAGLYHLKRHPGRPCACEFSDDNGDTVLSWCEFHKELRERIAELKNIILEAPHHEDCASLIWESGTPRSPCDCWKRKALEDG